MAAVKRNRMKASDEMHAKTRKLAQTTQLVKRLRQYALGQKDDMGQDVELDSTRVRAIDILLSKTLPSLTATTVEATVDATLTLEKLTESELDERLKELQDKE